MYNAIHDTNNAMLHILIAICDLQLSIRDINFPIEDRIKDIKYGKIDISPYKVFYQR